jgi:hypothetical protein
MMPALDPQSRAAQGDATKKKSARLPWRFVSRCHSSAATTTTAVRPLPPGLAKDPFSTRVDGQWMDRWRQ